MCGSGFHAAGYNFHGIIQKYVQLLGIGASVPYWSSILCAAAAALPHNPHPRYLAVKLDRQLTYRQHIEGLRGKVMARNNVIQCLSGSTWGANEHWEKVVSGNIEYKISL